MSFVPNLGIFTPYIRFVTLFKNVGDLKNIIRYAEFIKHKNGTISLVATPSDSARRTLSKYGRNLQYKIIPFSKLILLFKFVFALTNFLAISFDEPLSISSSSKSQSPINGTLFTFVNP